MPPRQRMPWPLSRRQPVGALVHSVAGVRSDVLEPHRRAIGPQGRQGFPVALDQRLVLARRPCASRGADRDLRVEENEHLLTWLHQLARARQRVADRAELSCVVGCSRRSEVLGLVAVVRVR